MSLDLESDADAVSLPGRSEDSDWTLKIRARLCVRYTY